jgi:choline dehydrogenase
MFDYIVVGAGSAGCVLANRLSEDPTTSVLLLEAGGPDRKAELHIPAAFSKLFKGPFDWAYYTEEQPTLHKRRLYWPRGKVLGGSSSLNAMIYTRGHRHDFDSWSDLGCRGWGFEDLLPYFKKSENQERGPSEHHATDGPLCVSDLRTVNPLSRAFVDACVEAGMPRNDDFNGAVQEGAGIFQVTQKRGRRHSAADAYLKPALNRPNLTVRTHAQATQILFAANRATSIAYIQGGQDREATATREILLCGGAVNSPHLLMLSGVGPADHLRSLGIPVVAVLPGVGRNLSDHLATIVACECRQPVSLADAESFVNLIRYMLFKAGPLTSNVGEAGAFLKTKPDLPAPDLEVIFGPAYYLNHGFDNPPGHGFSVGPVLLSPKSRGFIELRSANPLEPPIIEPKYLDQYADLRVLVEGVKLCRRLSQSKALAPFRGPEYWPGSGARTDADLAEAVRARAETLYHPLGTCKMGSDPMAVVDNHLRVHGIDGLRVVDGSILPTQITGHPNAAIIMIGEKAADLIRHGTK